MTTKKVMNISMIEWSWRSIRRQIEVIKSRKGADVKTEAAGTQDRIDVGGELGGLDTAVTRDEAFDRRRSWKRTEGKVDAPKRRRGVNI